MLPNILQLEFKDKYNLTYMFDICHFFKDAVAARIWRRRAAIGHPQRGWPITHYRNKQIRDAPSVQHSGPVEIEEGREITSCCVSKKIAARNNTDAIRDTISFDIKPESFRYPAHIEVNLFFEDIFSVKQKYQFDSLRSIKISWLNV